MGDKKITDSKNKFDQVRIITNPLSSNKTLDADGMIENILSKKQVFVKKSPNSFPLWLTPDSGKVPHLYSEVWKVVQIPSNPGFCNTAILSQILMSSGVETQALGYIWSLANKKFIGVLTEEELYLTMALIAILQNGKVVHNLDILKQVHEPIIPKLDLNVIKHFHNLQRSPQPHLSFSNVPPYNTPAYDFMNSHSNTISHKSGASPYASHSYDPNMFGNTEPIGRNYDPSSSNTTQGLFNAYQNQGSVPRDSITIQNISSIVQQQSSKEGNASFSWNDAGGGDDDDEFTDFQSSTLVRPSAPAPNVSITLNPIHYLMAISTKPSESNTNKRSQNNSAVPILSNLDTSLEFKNKTIFKNDNLEDDDFTEFQSSTDFDVEIKQPNLLQNIKTMIDNKNAEDKNQSMIQQASNDHIVSVLVDNVSKTIKEEVLGKQNLSTYSTSIRDYSALKEIPSQETSLFGDHNQTAAIKTQDLGTSNVFESCDDSIIIQTGNELPPGKVNIKSLNTADTSKLNSFIHSSIVTNALSSATDTDFDDDFTEFKQAVPLVGNIDETVNKQCEPVKLEIDSKPSIKYDYLRVLDDDSLNAQIGSNVNEVMQEGSDFLFQQVTPQEGNSLEENDILFGNNNTYQSKSQDLIHDEVKNVDDEFDEFMTHTLSRINDFVIDQPIAEINELTRENLPKNYQQEDDEFSNYKQAPTIAIDPPSQTIRSVESINEINVELDEMVIENVEASKRDYNGQEKKESNEKQEDKYSALRGLDFLVSDKDASDEDGDTISLQEDKDRDISDGDNVSLQLPSIESHEQDNIQTKCYEACVCTLETSLNLFVSNQIENSFLDHPKIIEHLQCLLEVYHVGKRLQRSGQLTSSITKLDSIWNALSMYISDATSFETTNQYEQDVSGGERCEICLCDSSLLHVVEENHSMYHPQCINLYLNCVDATLPM